MRDRQRDGVAGQAARIAAAVDALVVGEDDLGHVLVVGQMADELRPALWVALDDLPLLVRELAGLEHPVGEHDLADVVVERRGVAQPLLGLRAPGGLGDPPRVAGDGGRVTRGHVVAGVEEVEDDPHEAVALRLGVGGRLARGLGVALGLEQVALQAGVGDEDDAGEGETAAPTVATR